MGKEKNTNWLEYRLTISKVVFILEGLFFVLALIMWGFMTLSSLLDFGTQGTIFFFGVIVCLIYAGLITASYTGYHLVKEKQKKLE